MEGEGEYILDKNVVLCQKEENNSFFFFLSEIDTLKKISFLSEIHWVILKILATVANLQ